MRSSDPASHFGELTVASFRTWRSWAPCSCTGLDLSGADRGRTDDLLVANEALSQLSYSPEGSKRQSNQRMEPYAITLDLKVIIRGEKSKSPAGSG
jgi:hypothetical protein